MTPDEALQIVPMKPMRQQPAVLALRDPEQLVLYHADHLTGRDTRQRVRNGVHQVVNRDEADDRHQEQQGGEERQEEVVGEGGSHLHAVVADHLYRGALDELNPADRDPERAKDHQGATVLRCGPVVDVQPGASLAGNESAEASV